MTNKTISVIIPIYNRFDLVDESIISVHDQTYRPIELILVDDCSTEPYLPKVISEDGFKVILLHHNKNKGPGASRETGRLAALKLYILVLFLKT